MNTQGLTFDQIQALPAMVDLITAARALGIGRSKAYELAKGEEFPCRVIKTGGTYRVATADLMSVLGITPPNKTE
ncbi:helix-turn-helix domain-containing protein [Amycolatopsis saalfeldensis]|uniref:Helix-turn-helix domain-containing protein n=1 Tax=Amycolatopsis saalfeldensis TaxID=394193 RepID=A0A1H8YJX9_9PSEU|nr:helix-turn-helix domain-containing protein [Amycolatopsis saalfeldensis]SEP52449.1 hypothetical protein SAMN04489732_120112 [Amycolatopsis saalfeldensis]